MRRVLFQTLLSLGILGLSALGVLWIQSARPVDPPLLRADELATPVRARRVEQRARTPLVRTLPGVLEPWLVVRVRAEVPGRVLYPGGQPELGAAISGRRAGPGSGSGEGGTPVPVPADEGEAEALIVLDRATYRLERELAEQRLLQAEARVATGAAEIERAREVLALAETNLELARNALERLQGRLGTGANGSVAVSDQSVEDAVREVGRALGTLAERRAGLVQAEQQGRVELAAESAARQELELARTRESKSVIFPPCAGYVAVRSATEGEAVRVGDPLLEIAVLDPLRAVVHLPEELLYRLGAEHPPRARIRLQGRGNEDLSVREAVLVHLAPRADVRTRSVRAEFRLPNPVGALATERLDGRLPADLACEVEVELGLENASWVHESALRWGGGGPEVVRILEGADGMRVAAPLAVDLAYYQAGEYALAPSSAAQLAADAWLAVGELDALAEGTCLRVLGGGEERP